MWVKLKKHTVKSVSGNKALLKEINSWVYTDDLTVLQSSAKIVAVGSKVKNKARCDLRRTHGGTWFDGAKHSADKDSHRRQNTGKRRSP